MKDLNDFNNCLLHTLVSELLKIGPVKIFLKVSTCVQYSFSIGTFFFTFQALCIKSVKYHIKVNKSSNFPCQSIEYITTFYVMLKMTIWSLFMGLF